MTTAPATTCYRHPDRETGRHCTRCGRPACSDCLLEASVGAHCVDCVREAQSSRTDKVRRQLRGGELIATKAIIAINVIVFFVIAIRDNVMTGYGATSTDLSLYGPAVHNGDWYRVFTSSVVHYGAMHLIFNMLVLYLVGRVLEPGAGALRFTILYVVSVIGGAAGALILSPHVHTGGASGGVFGIAAAATLVMHRQGVRFWDTGFGPLILINLFLNVTLMTNVSIGGHIGGLISGALAAEVMMQARKAGQPRLGIIGALGVGVGSMVLALAVAGS
jgi:membrane associated rhomboid family serine protease